MTFADSEGVVEPIGISLWHLSGHPAHDSIQNGLPSAFHTATVQGMASLDGFKPPKQKHSLCIKVLRTNYDQIETITSAYRSPWLCGEPRHSRHGRYLRLPWSSFRSFLRFSLGEPAHSAFFVWFVSIWRFQNRSLLTETATFDIVA